MIFITNNDFVDLSGYYDNIAELKADFADDGILNQSNTTTSSGAAVDYSDNASITGSLTLSGATDADLTYDTTNVICFSRGTLINTCEGDRAIENLSQGDLGWTKDNDFQPIRWIGSKILGQNALEKAPNLRPVRIKAGALGIGLPKRDLLVSPQHRILVNSKIAKRMTKEDEMLVSPKHLLQLKGVDYDDTVKDVVYFHFLFDRHEIVLAEGSESESLFTGPEALKAVDEEARDEILSIFQELKEVDYKSWFVPARTILSCRQSRKLTVRHVQNRKPLLM